MAPREGSDTELLAELKLEGRAPYSHFATACAGAVGALIGVSLAIDEGRALGELILQAPRVSMHAAETSALLEEVRGHVIWILLTPALLAVALSAAAGLFQTRFLFSVRRLSRSFTQRTRHTTSYPERVLIRVARGGALCVASTLFTFIAARIVMRDILSPLVHTRSYLLQWASELGAPLAATVCILLPVMGIVAWISARALFIRRHRSLAPHARAQEWL